MADDPTPADTRITRRDLGLAFVASLTIISVTAIVVSNLVDHPPPAPVTRVTTDDLEDMAAIARAIRDDPRSTPDERRTAGQIEAVVTAVESGEVEVVQSPTSVVPPPTSTTTTTTLPPPTTVVVHDWPGESDAPLVTIPPVTIP